MPIVHVYAYWCCYIKTSLIVFLTDSSSCRQLLSQLHRYQLNEVPSNNAPYFTIDLFEMRAENIETDVCGNKTVGPESHCSVGTV